MYDYIMKTCGTCKLKKDISEFPPNKKNEDGLNRKCRTCYNEYMRVWYSKNQGTHKARVAKARPKHRAGMYGLTIDEMTALFEKYDGLCHLCGIRPAVAIDHCHSTGVVRGALCNACNTGLGKLGDSVEGLQKAIEYLSAASIPSVL